MKTKLECSSSHPTILYLWWAHDRKSNNFIRRIAYILAVVSADVLSVKCQQWSESSQAEKKQIAFKNFAELDLNQNPNFVENAMFVKYISLENDHNGSGSQNGVAKGTKELSVFTNIFKKRKLLVPLLHLRNEHNHTEVQMIHSYKNFVLPFGKTQCTTSAQ